MNDEELPQWLQDRLKHKDFVISETFESPKGDKCVAAKRTICDIFRTLYSLTIIHLQDKPEALKDIVDLLEEGFIAGMVLVNRMVEHKVNGYFNNISEEQIAKESLYREEKNRIVKQLQTNTWFLKRHRNK